MTKITTPVSFDTLNIYSSHVTLGLLGCRSLWSLLVRFWYLPKIYDRRQNYIHFTPSHCLYRWCPQPSRNQVKIHQNSSFKEDSQNLDHWKGSCEHIFLPNGESVQKVKQLVDELMESKQAKHNTLDDLQGLMSNIQSTIVTKVWRFVECFELMLNFRICLIACWIKRSTRTNSMTL